MSDGLSSDYRGHGVQIIDISDPYEPIARSAAINNSDGFTALSNVADVAITTIGSKRMPWRYLMLGIERAAFKS